jgi:hypothetical protein
MNFVLHVIVRSAAFVILMLVIAIRLAAILHVSLFGASLPLVTIGVTFLVTAVMFLAMRHRSETPQ